MNNKSNQQSISFRLISLLAILCFAGSGIAAESSAQKSPVRVTITTHLGDEQHFRAGDEISLLLSLNIDAYLLLVYRDASGKLVKLFPVRRNDNGWVRSGDFMPFPRRADRLRLIVAPPFGEEQVWAFVADEAFPSKPLKNITDIESLRIRLQGTGIPYSEAFTRLTTHADQR